MSNAPDMALWLALIWLAVFALIVLVLLARMVISPQRLWWRRVLRRKRR